MRNVISAVLFLVLLTGAVSPLAVLAADEMILDTAKTIQTGGFENLAAGTALATGSSSNGVFYTGNGAGVISSDYKKSGSNSAKIIHTGSSGQNAALNYLVALEGGKTYDIKAWVRFDPSFTSVSSIYIRLAGFGDIYYPDRGTSPSMSGDVDFVEIKTTVTLQPGNDYGKSRINISSSAGAGEIFYVDDVSCMLHEETPTPTPTPTPTLTPTPTPTPTQTPTPPGGNQIGGGDFEGFELDETFPASTNLTGEFFAMNSNAVVSADYSKSGQQSAKITHTGEGANTNAALNYYIALEAGKTYIISAWVRYAPSYAASSYIYIRLADFGNIYFNSRGRTAAISGTGDFVEVKTVLTLAAEDADGKAYNYSKSRINVSSEANAGETFYVDDVTLKEIPDVAEAVSTVTNKIADEWDIPLLPVAAEIELTFNCELDETTVKVENLRLNGTPYAGVSASLDGTGLQITLGGLGHSRFYTLSSVGFKDVYGRDAAPLEIKFKTAPKVYVGEKNFEQGGAPITDGLIKNGVIKGEITAMRNMSGENCDVTVILVLYNNGEMEEIKTADAVIAPDEDGSAKISAEITVNDPDNRKLALYIWDSIESGVTLSEWILLNAASD